MKVFMVIELYEDEGTCFHEVFSSLKLAKKYVKQKQKESPKRVFDIIKRIVIEE